VKFNRSLIARAGWCSLPVTAFGPLAGTVLTGRGTLWLVLPVGSLAAALGAGGTRSGQEQPTGRGVLLEASEPAVDVVPAPAPAEQITVEYSWSDKAA
jgi:hypothetical protein